MSLNEPNNKTILTRVCGYIETEDVTMFKRSDTCPYLICHSSVLGQSMWEAMDILSGNILFSRIFVLHWRSSFHQCPGEIGLHQSSAGT
jgi:hypothetical protein